MPQTTYNYDLQIDFPNQAVNTDVLTAEIEGSSITTALVGISVLNDDVDITFVDALSGADKTTLDGIVAAHQGVAFSDTVQRVFSEAESTTTDTSYQEKLTLSTGPLPEGDYLISWYCEIGVDTLLGGSGVFAQVTYNGTERGFTSSSSDFYRSFSGSAIVQLSAGDSPTIAINWRRVGASNTAKIRRARLLVAMQAPVNGGPG